MFKKILIANRGEIACRIAKSCKKMGISTVGIYSDADSRAHHLEYMDEIVNVGAPESANSYLNIGKIIDVSKKYKVDAVHPGYGFLSENATFASKLKSANITFIGPPVNAIKAMGDKIESKKIARKAGINVIPGGEKAINSISLAKKEAKKIGYPVMIKASAGGGGKGMRIVKNEKDLKAGFSSAKNEAKHAFGDDRIFIEKFITDPRHIEIQILADRKGNTIYLLERECSVQRRHQKIIEECPSPLVDEAMRKKMGEQAIMLSKAVKYYSAGTVEFVASSDKSFYFLEMNTRLQVEHPATEMVVGLDLVELMINVADKKTLNIKQSDITPNGWAIESRIYAEDPLHNFMPSTGRIRTYLSPEIMRLDNERIRLDSGVNVGSEVSMFYDPMMAKLISHANDRESARKNLSKALDFFVIEGVTNNISFLSNVLNNDAFKLGKMNTGFIDQEYEDGFKGNEVDEPVKLIIAMAALSLKALENKSATYHDKKHQGEYIVNIDELEFLFEYNLFEGKNILENRLILKNKKHTYEINVIYIYGGSLLKIIFENKNYYIQYKKILGGYKITHGGFRGDIFINTPYSYNLIKSIPKRSSVGIEKNLLSPMPGRVVKVLVKQGQKVKYGEDLIILDAMKMENIIKSEKDTEISEVFVKENDTVVVEQVLLGFLN